MMSSLLTLALSSAAPPVVTVPGLGSILGNITAGTSVATFKGIPYASAPVGELRWKPPVDHAPWKKQIDGTKFGNVRNALSC